MCLCVCVWEGEGEVFTSLILSQATSFTEEGSGHTATIELSPLQKLDMANQIRALCRSHLLSWSTSCVKWMSASCYLTAVVDNCVSRQQLCSCSVTRPFLSLQRVWLARLHDSLIALYVNLNEAVALVRITQGYTFISSVSYVCLPQQYVAHFHIAPDGAFIKHTRLVSA